MTTFHDELRRLAERLNDIGLALNNGECYAIADRLRTLAKAEAAEPVACIAEAQRRLHALALANGWGTDSDAYQVSCMLEDLRGECTHPAPTADAELPPLPEPASYAPQMMTEDAYTADQMRDYARAARRIK